MEKANLLLDYLDLLLECKNIGINSYDIDFGINETTKALNQYFFEQQKTAKAD